jgi:hypothetical protein
MIDNHMLNDIFNIGSEKCASLEDLSESMGGKTITNTVEELAAELEVQWLVYKDSFGVWSAWHVDHGFVILDEADNEYKASDQLQAVIKELKLAPNV